jgi:hypothetical protein
MESLSWNRTPNRTSSRSQLRHPSARLGDSGVLQQGSHLNPLLDPIVRFDADQDVSCTGATLDSCAIGAMWYKILRPNQTFARRSQCFCSATASCPDHSLSWLLNLSGIAHSRFSRKLRNRLCSLKCCMTWECLSQISFVTRKPHRTHIRIHFPHSGRFVANPDITHVGQCQRVNAPANTFIENHIQSIRRNSSFRALYRKFGSGASGDDCEASSGSKKKS